MKIIGVTGGIATGKTTVARLLCARGGLGFDADACVHDLMRRDAALRAAIDKAFPGVVQHDQINRSLLGEKVFADEARLAQLEQVLHPFVREEEMRFINTARAQSAAYVVLDIPLLFETGAETLCDAVVVTACDEATQRARAMQRPAMTQAKLDGILKRQMAQTDREAKADYIIRTQDGEASAAAQAEAILDKIGIKA